MEGSGASTHLTGGRLAGREIAADYRLWQKVALEKQSPLHLQPAQVQESAVFSSIIPVISKNNLCLNTHTFIF